MTSRRLAPLRPAPPAIALLAVLALLASPRATTAQQPDAASLVGKKVITKKGTVLKVDGKVVYDEGRAESLKKGVDHRQFHIYQVRKARNDEVWLFTTEVTAQGWVPISNVVPLDAALDYIDDVSSVKPNLRDKYLARSAIWQGLGKIEQAIEDCDTAIRHAPRDDKVAYFMRGRLWMQKGNFDRAVEDFTRAIQIDPRFVLAYVDRADSWCSKGDHEKALEDLNKAIEIDPESAFALCSRSVFWMTKQTIDPALADLDKAIRIKPNYAKAYKLRGTAWYAKAEYQKSLDDWVKAVELDPDHADSFSLRATARLALKQYQEAVMDFDEAIRLAPNDGVGYYNRAEARRALLDDEKALADLSRAIELDPKIANAFLQRGIIRARKTEYPGAVDDFGRAIELEPGDPNRAATFFNRALCWHALKEYQNAVDDLSLAIQINPRRADFHNGRAMQWNALGEHDKALADLTRAIQIHPDSKFYHLARGITLIALEDYARAEAELGEVVRLDPYHSSALYHRGLAAFHQGRFDQAIDDATKADGFGHPPASCCRLRGDAWYAKKDYEKAIANFEYATVQDPLDHQAHDSLAWILATAPDAQFRDGAHAVEAATRACELTDWKNVEHLTTLAASCAEAGDFENAVKRQQEAIDQTADDHPTKANRLARLGLYAANQPFHAAPGPDCARDVRSASERRTALAAFAIAAIESEHQRARGAKAAANPQANLEAASPRKF